MICSFNWVINFLYQNRESQDDFTARSPRDSLWRKNKGRRVMEIFLEFTLYLIINMV